MSRLSPKYPANLLWGDPNVGAGRQGWCHAMPPPSGRGGAQACDPRATRARPARGRRPPVACDGAADNVLGSDASAVRRELRRERGQGLRAVRPGRPHHQQGPRRRRRREGHLARSLRQLQHPRHVPLARQFAGKIKGRSPSAEVPVTRAPLPASPRIEIWNGPSLLPSAP